MSVVTITKCNSVKNTVDYLFTKQKKNDFRERVGTVYCSLANEQQFKDMAVELKQKYDRIEAYNLVQSFKKDEFDINNTDDVETVNDLGYELASELYPNSPCLVVTHIDGNSKCLHNHIVVLNHDFETGNCIVKNRQFKQVSYVNDELMRKYGLEVCKPKKLQSSDDFLKQKLDDAISKSDSFDDFVTLLNTEYSISVDAYNTKGKIKKSMSYSYTDEAGKLRKRRSSSISDNYTVEAIKSRISQNKAVSVAPVVNNPVKASDSLKTENKAVSVDTPVKAEKPVNQPYNRYTRQQIHCDPKKYQEQLNKILGKQEMEKFNKLSREYDIANQSRNKEDWQYE